MRRLLTILLLISSTLYGQRSSTKIGLFNKIDSVAYGYNGVWNFAGRSLSDPDVLDSLKTLKLFDIYRYPGGTIANEFNWRTGLPDDNTGEPCLLADVKALVDAVHCDIIFNLNLITKTLDDQLEMLAAASALGIEIKYVELGNEFNNINNIGHLTLFPTPQAYADTAARWMAAIKAVYDCQVAFVGGDRHAWDGGGIWNSVMLSKRPDALTWHVSPNISTFWDGMTVDSTAIFDDVLADWYLEGFNTVTIPIWNTENNYSYDDDNILPLDAQIQATYYTGKRIRRLIKPLTGTKIIVVRGIEGAKQGAFVVSGGSIVRNTTAYATDLLFNNP